MHLFDWVYKLLRSALGMIFIYAGSTKLFAPENFATLIEAFGIVPDQFLMPASIFLPAVEVIAGIGLLFDIRGSLAVIFGLLALFIAILGFGLWMGLDVDCGCFGPEDPEAEAFHGLKASLYRDLAMLVMVAFIYFWRRYRAVKTLDVVSVFKPIFLNKED